ncbi:hypothetical protein FS842_004638, partial [Serendipita sp. 407]
MAATTTTTTDTVVESDHNTESPTTSTSTSTPIMAVATAENSTQSAFATQRSKVLKIHPIGPSPQPTLNALFHPDHHPKSLWTVNTHVLGCEPFIWAIFEDHQQAVSALAALSQSPQVVSPALEQDLRPFEKLRKVDMDTWASRWLLFPQYTQHHHHHHHQQQQQQYRAYHQPLPHQNPHYYHHLHHYNHPHYQQQQQQHHQHYPLANPNVATALPFRFDHPPMSIPPNSSSSYPRVDQQRIRTTTETEPSLPLASNSGSGPGVGAGVGVAHNGILPTATATTTATSASVPITTPAAHALVHATTTTTAYYPHHPPNRFQPLSSLIAGPTSPTTTATTFQQNYPHSGI